MVMLIVINSSFAFNAGVRIDVIRNELQEKNI